MANNLTAVISADTSKFVEEVKGARHMLDKYVAEAKKSKSAIHDSTKATTEQITAYDRVIKSLESVASGTFDTAKQQKVLKKQITELKQQWQGMSDELKSNDFGMMVGDSMLQAQTELKRLNDGMSKATFGQTVKRQLRNVTNEINALRQAYSQLSIAEQQSSKGSEMSSKINSLIAKAGELKDNISDTNAEIKMMASDTPKLDIFNNMVGISADALTAYSGIIAKLTGDEKSLQNAIATVAAAQGIANVTAKITASLDSSSILMVNLRKIQEKALARAIAIRTTAEVAGTKATKSAIVAQTAFNAIAKANPYVLLATAVAVAGTALFAYSRYQTSATEAEEQAKKSAEQLKAKKEELNKKTNELSESAGKAQVTYMKLKAQWQSLRTEAEKTKWINDNSSAFSELGLSINSVKTAEDIFVNNTQAVVKAIVARAIATKKAEQASDRLMKLYKDMDEKSVKSGHYYKPTKMGEVIPYEDREDAKAHGVKLNSLGQVKGNATTPEFTKENLRKADEWKKGRARQLQKKRQEYFKKIEDEIYSDVEEAYETANKYANVLNNYSDKPTKTTNRTTHNTTNTTNTTSDKDTPDVGSLGDLYQQLSDLESQQKNHSKYTAEEYKKRRNELEKAIKIKKQDLGFNDDIPQLNSLKWFTEEIAKRNDKIETISIDTEEGRKQIEQLNNEIDTFTEAKRNLEILITPVVDRNDFVEIHKQFQDSAYENAVNLSDDNITPKPYERPKKGKRVKSDNRDQLKSDLDFYVKMEQSMADKDAKITKRKENKIQLTPYEEDYQKSYDDVVRNIKKLKSEIAQINKDEQLDIYDEQIAETTKSAINDTISGIGNMNSAISSLSNTWGNLTANWDDLSGIEKFTSIISSFVGTLQTLISTYETVNSLKEQFAFLSELEAVKSEKEMAKKITVMTVNRDPDDIDLSGKKQAQAAEEVTTNATIEASNRALSASYQALTAAKVSSLYAAIPFAGTAMATADMAIYKGLWTAAALPTFAEGGIFQGQSTIGDFNVARVNDGEMILSTKQQAKLFRLLNGGGFAQTNNPNIGANVTFKINGSDLIGVIRNKGKLDGVKYI